MFDLWATNTIFFSFRFDSIRSTWSEHANLYITDAVVHKEKKNEFHENAEKLLIYSLYTGLLFLEIDEPYDISYEI
jgi:hypothetical protein